MAKVKTMTRLNALLIRAGLSQRALAERVGIDPSMVSYVARGNRPSLKVASAMAEAIGDANPHLRIEAYLWLIDMGFAPQPMQSAHVQDIVAALEAVGVRR